MPVVTRSQAKQQDTSIQASTSTSPVSLGNNGTVILTCPSATGQGVHTRWIRQGITIPADLSESPQDDITADDRYITPAPMPYSVPDAPRKAKGDPGHILISSSNWTIGSVENTDEEPRGDHLCENCTLASPFQFSAPQHMYTPRPLSREPNIQDLMTRSNIHSIIKETEKTPRGQRALGPSGTFLLDENGRDLYLRG